MTCHEAQDWLLQADDPLPKRCGSAAVARHVTECSDCAAFAMKLTNLETNYRSLPLPAQATQTQVTFLERLAPSVHPRVQRPRFLAVRRWAVAAAILIGVSAVAWLLIPSNGVQASTDVVERLVDWNLNLANAETPAERQRIYAASVADLESSLQQSRLPDDEQGIAQSLFQNGAWLVQNDDPMSEAERFHDVADQLLVRLDDASGTGDDKKLEKLARLYSRIAVRGITPNLDRAERAAKKDSKHEKKLQAIALRRERHADQLEKLMKKAPAGAQKELRKAHAESRGQAKRPKKKAP